MPDTGSYNDKKLDEMLGKAMKSHSEPVPADFTRRVLAELTEKQQRAVLAQITHQERLALAGPLAAAAAAVIAIFVFPGRLAGLFKTITAGLTRQTGAVADYGKALMDSVGQSAPTGGGRWQFYAALAVVLAFALYGVASLLLGDRLKTA